MSSIDNTSRFAEPKMRVCKVLVYYIVEETFEIK